MKNAIIAIIAVLTAILFLLVGYKSMSHGQVPTPVPMIQQPELTPPVQKIVPPKIEIKPEPPRKMPTNYQEALGYVAATNEQLLLVFYSKTCGPCHRMRSTYADSRVREALRKSGVALIYDLDVAGPERTIAQQYNIQGVPAYFIVDGTGKIINSGIGYLSPDGFLKWLTQKDDRLRVIPQILRR